jgi:hypothetical protein
VEGNGRDLVKVLPRNLAGVTEKTPSQNAQSLGRPQHEPLDCKPCGQLISAEVIWHAVSQLLGFVFKIDRIASRRAMHGAARTHTRSFPRIQAWSSGLFGQINIYLPFLLFVGGGDSPHDTPDTVGYAGVEHLGE